MRWSYKIVNYELKKEGLLGSSFLDESEIEQSLNEYGKSGWELVNMIDTAEGVTAVFKQPLSASDDFIPASFEKPVAKNRQQSDEKSGTPEVNFAGDEICEAVIVEDTEETNEATPEDVPQERKKKAQVKVAPVEIGAIRIQ